MPDNQTAQPLFLVIGGELEQLDGIRFRNPEAIDLVGVFTSEATAHAAWKAKAQSSVDNAHMRYFVVDLHTALLQNL